MSRDQFDDKVFRFRVTLLESDPEIWRLIEVPGWYDFWDLHVAIQDAMGWTDSHLHMFTPVGEAWSAEWRIGIPLDDFDDLDYIAGWETPMCEHFSASGDSLDYTYDFGDSWMHRVELVDVSTVDPGVEYPRCLDGAGTCPPEDCGGTHGFELLREILMDPSDEEYYGWIEWLGGPERARDFLDPHSFEPSAVTFDDPDERWEDEILNWDGG